MGMTGRRAGSGIGTGLLLAALAALPPRIAAASPFNLFGAGPRGAAMGGALTTLSEDFMAAYYNPASLVNTDRLVFGLGYSRLFSNLSLDGRDFEMSDTRYGATSGGFSLAGPVGGYRLGGALAFSLTDQATIHARLLGPMQQRYVLLNNQTQVADLIAAGALQLFPWLAFGGGLSAGAELSGAVTLDANFFPNEASGILDVEVKTRVFPIGGILLTPFEGLRLSVVYRGEYEIPLSLPTAAVLTLVEGSDAGAVLTFFVSQIYYFKPQQVEAGISYAAWNRVTLSAGLAWLDWSAFPNPNVVGDLSATGLLAGIIVVPQVAPVEPPDFNDILVPRFGMEAKAAKGELWDLFVRLGYAYEPSPSPMKGGSVNLLDNDKHIASAGIGLFFRDPWGILLGPVSIDLAAQYFRFVERVVRKEDPSDPAGDLVFGGDRFVIHSMLTFRFE